MWDLVASHIYECIMMEAGELGALLADPRTYNEVMIMPDAKQWEEALCADKKQLERLGGFSAPCELPYGTKKIETRAIFKKKRIKTGAGERWKARLVAQGFRQLFDADFFEPIVLSMLYLSTLTCPLRVWMSIWRLCMFTLLLQKQFVLSSEA